MELVEGEDLANRLARGPLLTHDALTIARQIADALDVAHERGIIHRDLKPANICLQRDGTVKVVDFGLAKPLLQGDTAPTLTAISQAAGAVIGTPAYMSPEQARGEAAGRELDIWAFGVVLYEMLTGRSPFSCPTTAETLARVLSAPVDEQLLPLDTPETVRRLIRRCLAKDPKRRVRHMGDVRNELDEALSAPSTDVSSIPPTPSRVNVVAPARALGWVAALGLAAFVIAYIVFASRGEQSREEVRLQMAPPAGMHFVSVPLAFHLMATGSLTRPTAPAGSRSN